MGCAASDCDPCVAKGPVTSFPAHQVHVTVEARRWDRFANLCGVLGVKPLKVLNYGPGLWPVADWFTSETVTGDNQSALEDADLTATCLALSKHRVLRIKIEAHPDVGPRRQSDDRIPQGSYFETHIKTDCVSPSELRPLVRDLGIGISGRLKTGTKVSIMATVRTHEAFREDHTHNVFKAHMALRTAGIKVTERPITEWTWYDSNPKHDNYWMPPHAKA